MKPPLPGESACGFGRRTTAGSAIRCPGRQPAPGLNGAVAAAPLAAALGEARARYMPDGRCCSGLAGGNRSHGAFARGRREGDATADHCTVSGQDAGTLLRPWQWIAALTLAAGLHAGLALMLVQQTDEVGAEAPGLGGLEIALGPAGGAPGTRERPTAASKAAEAAPIADTPPETPAPASPQAVRSARPPLPEPVRTAPAPISLPTTEPAAISTAQLEDSPAPSVAGVGGRAGAAESSEAGTRQDNASAGGLAGAEADYVTVLLAWLERHKKYPQRARARRQEGVMRLFIAIGRNGQVLEGRVEQSSGHPLLDRAALDMLARAKPLPPLFGNIPGERFEVIVPVHFFLARGQPRR